MPDVRIHQLEGFFHVAREGGYTKAAQAFPYPIGQPAVYQQVKGLQEALGVALVRQAGPRRTELTPEGRALFAFVAPFFEGLPNVLERVATGGAAPLVLASDQFLAMEALPPALRHAQKKCPGLVVRVEELATAEIVERVRSGHADAGLVLLLKGPPGLNWKPLGRIGAALLVPRSHPLAALGRKPTPQELAPHALIAYEGDSPGRVLTERLLHEAGGRLKIAAEVTFAQTMRALVRQGVAPAFVPYLHRSKNPKDGMARRDDTEDELPREPGTVAYDVSERLKGGALSFGVVYRAGTEESRAFAALFEGLRAAWT